MGSGGVHVSKIIRKLKWDFTAKNAVNCALWPFQLSSTSFIVTSKFKIPIGEKGKMGDGWGNKGAGIRVGRMR